MYILFDIGGTKTRITSSDGKTFKEPTIISTPQDFEEGVKAISKVAHEISGGEKIKGVAGGFPGQWDEERQVFVGAPNLPDWVSKPLKNRLEEEIGAPVVLGNDADVGALGEAVFGKGKGKQVVVYITISTGVGGGRIVDGKIDINAFGFEPGWQIIDGGGALGDGSRNPGYLEEYVSGKSMEKKFGKKPYEITDDDFWDEMAKTLAYGLNNVMVLQSPDIIVLGGSMMKEIGIPVESVRKYLADINQVLPSIPEIEKSDFGDSVGLYGAMAFVNQNFS